MVTNLLQDQQRAHKESKTSSTNMQLRKWCKPPHGWIRINVDAAYRINNARYTGAGCVTRDENGQFLRGTASRIRDCMSTREAEALSFKEAVTWWMQFKAWTSEKFQLSYYY